MKGKRIGLYNVSSKVLFSYSSPFTFMPIEKNADDYTLIRNVLLDKSDPQYDLKSEHLTRSIEQALLFRSGLNVLKREKASYPPIAIIAGVGTTTWLCPEGFRSNLDYPKSKEGDGRFMADEVSPVIADLEMPIYTTQNKHNALLCDIEVVSTALRDLNNRMKGRGVGLDCIEVGLS